MRTSVNLVVLVIALLFGGSAAFLARNWLATHSPNTAVEQAGTIVVANAPLAFGTAITIDNVSETAWPSKTLPEGAFAKIQDLVKDGPRVALSPFVRDEPIVSSKVSAPNERASLSTIIEAGKRAVTVPVDDVRGVAGFISPGDYVDVVLTRTNASEGPRDFAEVLLQHVKVLAIDQLSGERQERPTIAKAVTMEVTPEQSLKILLATNIGRLSLTLRQSGEESVNPAARVTDRDLFVADASPKTAELPRIAPANLAPIADLTKRKVSIVRSLKSEEYDVPRDTMGAPALLSAN